jgi:hypothetical protein
MYMKITRCESRNMISKLFMNYGKDFALTEKKRVSLFCAVTTHRHLYIERNRIQPICLSKNKVHIAYYIILKEKLRINGF